MRGKILDSFATVKLNDIKITLNLKACTDLENGKERLIYILFERYLFKDSIPCDTKTEILRRKNGMTYTVFSVLLMFVYGKISPVLRYRYLVLSNCDARFHSSC
jgi:hypothetical protein